MFDLRIPAQVRDCRLVSLLDLALGKDYVRSRIAEYLNRLIDIGVAGFRIDAAKHMWPEDVKAILDMLKDLNTRWFPAGTKPFIYQEVVFIYLNFTSKTYFLRGQYRLRQTWQCFAWAEPKQIYRNHPQYRLQP